MKATALDKLIIGAIVTGCLLIAAGDTGNDADFLASKVFAVAGIALAWAVYRQIDKGNKVNKSKDHIGANGGGCNPARP